MSLTPEDIAAVLTKSAGYDSMHTPRASAVLTGAWLEHFGTYAAYATRADLLAAVTEHHREPHDRMLQPADLTVIIRARHRDNHARTDPNERALPGATAGGDLPDYPQEWTSDERLAAYWQMIKARSRPATTDNWRIFLRSARKRASQEADQRWPAVRLTHETPSPCVPGPLKGQTGPQGSF